MAKDYGHTRRPARRQSTAPKLLGWVLVAFLSGYFTATIFDADSLSAWINNNLLPQSEETPVAGKKAPHQKPVKPKFEFYTLLSKEAGARNSSSAVAPSATPLKPTPAVPTPAVAVNPVPVTPTTPATLSVAQAAALAQIEAAQSKAIGHSVAPVTASNAAPVAPVAEVKPLTPTTTASKDAYLLQLASFRTRSDAEHMKASLTLKGFNVIITQVMQQQLTWFRVQVGPYASKDLAVKAQQEVARSERINGMIRKMDA